MARIVFCEDDPQIQKLIRVAMRPTPHETLVAPDGRAGLALIASAPTDLVVTDVHMPELDGYALVAALHNDSRLAGIPVLFLTASAQREQVESAFAHGAAGFLAKPFGSAQLRDKVAEVLNRSRFQTASSA